jgi:hypothetical protein
MTRRPNMTLEELNKWFLQQKNITNSGCWEWTKCINGGYGKTTIKGKRVLVHRYSLQLYLKREIPNNLEVRHLCNNPICFNPEHLKEGTHYENMRDMVNSNRQAKGENLSKRLKNIVRKKLIGEENSNSKLNKEQVLHILTYKNIPNTLNYLSKLYNVSVEHIRRIHNGKSWKHLQ